MKSVKEGSPAGTQPAAGKVWITPGNVNQAPALFVQRQDHGPYFESTPDNQVPKIKDGAAERHFTTVWVFKMSSCIQSQMWLRIKVLLSKCLIQMSLKCKTQCLSLFVLHSTLCCVHPLSVFTVALGCTVNGESGNKQKVKDNQAGVLVCSQYAVDFVTVPCWMTSPPSYHCPDATREISGL